MVACTNCGAQNQARTLDVFDAQNNWAMTSDARRLHGRQFTRRLCRHCGVVEILYDPADCLAQHYARDYDLSEAVQNNLVVMQGRAQPKKSLLHAPLLEALKKLPANACVLEVACGRGELITQIQSIHPAWECLGIDPSPDVPKGKNFIRGFFELEKIPGKNFDAIIAHGFLNRSAPLKELAKMRALLRPGGILSAEIMILEDSLHAPMIWDHTYMYPGSVWRAWLECAGFRITYEHANGTTLHMLCEAVAPNASALPVSSDLVNTTQERMNEYAAHWSNVRKNYERLAAASGEKFYLFGAGMFSGIMIGMAGTSGIRAVLDDVKAGSTFHGLPVIALQDAQPGTVALCTRPHYVPVMQQKAQALGLKVQTL